MQYENLKDTVLERLGNELSKDLHYHSVAHTRDVIAACAASADRRGLTEENKVLLMSAAVLHDSGFLNTTKDHELEGVSIAKKMLPSFGYTSDHVQRISDMIMATKIPQSPKSELGCMICDADLDYLGRDDFYKIGSTLFAELQAHSVLQTEQEWDAIQIKFLSSHSFHTEWSIRVREPVKQKYLMELKQKWK
jgi:predicted metal-dependent HD superfamily phosphohydrolase